MQAVVVMLSGIFLLGCPIDEEDIFNGDVTVVNNTGANLEYVSVQETGAASSNLGLLADTASITYSGYDCATSYVNSVRALAVDADTDSTAFIPPCGGTTTITWGVGLVDTFPLPPASMERLTSGQSP
jgi:hypothetical protein